jgi:hypothetical protein
MVNIRAQLLLPASHQFVTQKFAADRIDWGDILQITVQNSMEDNGQALSDSQLF